VVLLIALLVLLSAIELRTSWLEAHLLHTLDAHLTYTVRKGAAPGLLHAPQGPYDERLGYAELSRFLSRLDASGFEAASQARVSPWLAWSTSFGLFPVYGEKTQAGLTIRDRTGAILFARRRPNQIYRAVQDIPPVILQSLLFIEDRDLIEPRQRFENPAVQWVRLGHATIDFGLHTLGFPLRTSGGSTLATQLQKFRHSPAGRTDSPLEKLRQMTAASLDAYRDGPDTSAARRRIALAYLNSIPLGAMKGYGAIDGLQDGLRTWFGTDADRVNQELTAPRPPRGATLAWRARGRAYREVLTLLLAIRQPTLYQRDPVALSRKVDRYLRLLARHGIISRELSSAALAERLQPRRADHPPRFPFLDYKAADAVRINLLTRLGLSTLTALDEIDLSARTTLDGEATHRVTAALERLKRRDADARAGLIAPQLLDRGNPAGITYSFTLYERTAGANLLRVQTDTVDGPLNVNQDTRMELGSTAKLRTLVTYLQVIASLHAQYGGLTPAQLAQARVDPRDTLSQWAVAYLSGRPDADLKTMLQAALERRYSASPSEAFFTGGGLLRFANFERSEDQQIVTVSDAFHRSINLAFIRLMRDLVRHFEFGPRGVSSAVLDDAHDPRRARYLARFAEEEGGTFLTRFYAQDQGVPPEKALTALIARHRPSPFGAAAAFRVVHPRARVDQLAAFLHGVDARWQNLPAAEIARAYRESDPAHLVLGDAAFLARTHPLQLWLLGYLRLHPGATLREVLGASTQARLDAYTWLFKGRDKAAQDSRIETILEQDAFQRIGASWQQLGYPFRSLVPSYATVLGSSGDTPAALAHLAGIVLNGGVEWPTESLEQLRFAEGTPFEATIVPKEEAGRRVLPEEIADAVKSEMLGVVREGTGQRLAQGFNLGDGTVLPVGGKTGTGDNRFTRETSSGPAPFFLDRTATFVFILGDRFFGTITAFVPGRTSASYDFTSSLAVAILKTLEPELAPLLRAGGAITPAPPPRSPSAQ
jgi:membrane peptidoglycan carboxypeptidase